MTWEDYLAPGERLLWEGRPRKGVRVWPAAVFSILGFPFLVGGLFALREGLGFKAPFFDVALIAMGLVFVALGGHLVAGVWIVEATRHRRIRYALSDRAGYIREGTRVDRIPLTGNPVDAVMAEDGSGTIHFGFRDKANRSAPRAGFENIADAARVAELLEART